MDGLYLRLLWIKSSFNNISVLPQMSVLLVEEAGEHGETLENTADLPRIGYKFYHIKICQIHIARIWNQNRHDNPVVFGIVI